MVDPGPPTSDQEPEDSWGELKAICLGLVFLGFVYLHGGLNVAAEHELAEAPTLLTVARAVYTVGFIVITSSWCMKWSIRSFQ